MWRIGLWLFRPLSPVFRSALLDAATTPNSSLERVSRDSKFASLCDSSPLVVLLYVGTPSPSETAMRARVRLTPRERDLLHAILDGCSNKEIAARLGISVQTVKNRLAVVYAKCGVSSRLELAIYASRNPL